MKRSDILKLIANQLDFLNGSFTGLRDNFTEQELQRADVILTTIEEAGMAPPEVVISDTLTLGAGVTLSSIRKERKWEAE